MLLWSSGIKNIAIHLSVIDLVRQVCGIVVVVDIKYIAIHLSVIWLLHKVSSVWCYCGRQARFPTFLYPRSLSLPWIWRGTGAVKWEWSPCSGIPQPHTRISGFHNCDCVWEILCARSSWVEYEHFTRLC